jgi:hypothetical protein
MQVSSFLPRYAPFEHLSADELERGARSVQIEYFPAGTTILHQAGEPARFLYVVRRGAVELFDEDRVVDLLQEGEVFGHPSLLSGLSPGMEVRSYDDTICYLVEAIAEDVFGTARTGIPLREDTGTPDPGEPLGRVTGQGRLRRARLAPGSSGGTRTQCTSPRGSIGPWVAGRLTRDPIIPLPTLSRGGRRTTCERSRRSG